MLSVHHAAQHCPTIKIILILVYFVFALKAKKQTAEQTMACLLFPGSIIIKYLYINRKLCVCEINLEIYIVHNISYPGFQPRVALELAGGDNRCKTVSGAVVKMSDWYWVLTVLVAPNSWKIVRESLVCTHNVVFSAKSVRTVSRGRCFVGKRDPSGTVLHCRLCLSPSSAS